MIESWEQSGLIDSELASLALSPQPSHTPPNVQVPATMRQAGLYGYLVAIPGPAVALLVADLYAGPGSTLLVVLLLAVAWPIRNRPKGRFVLRIRRARRLTATRLAHSELSQSGPMAHEVMLKDRADRQACASTLITTNHT